MRDPGLRDHGSELKVGALVLISLITFVVGLWWISDTRFGGPTLRLVGLATDAGQITPDSEVLFRGIAVGKVDDVRLEANQVVVTLSIFDVVDLPADTRGVIKPSGFLGTQLVELIPGVANPSLVTGDTIALSRTLDLMSLASSLGDETGVLLERVESVLSERMIENLEQSSSSFAAAMQELTNLLSSERDAVRGLLANMDVASKGLVEFVESEGLARSLANLDTLASRLVNASEGFAETSASLETITTGLAKGEGSLGRLLKEDDFYEGLTETLANLRAASEEIALLTKDIRERPDRYLKDIKISVF